MKKKIKIKKEYPVPIIKEGSKILFFGEEIPIELTKGKHSRFDGKKVYLPESYSNEEKLQVIVKIYKNITKEVCRQKIRIYAPLLGLEWVEPKINSARTRWGSCSSKGTINFSFRLMMAPESAIEYVVIHELLHLKELNHSKDFWELMSEAMPEYKSQKEELKLLSKKEIFQEWYFVK